MTAKAIIEEIRPLGRESYKKVLLNHGIKEPCFGVKIEELKKIQKRIKKDYRLALELYDTGIYDAMYLAGLIADDAQMTKKDLQRWVEKARNRSRVSPYRGSRRAARTGGNWPGNGSSRRIRWWRGLVGQV
jgi:3-methyladenine DNA glycosylase AlkD